MNIVKFETLSPNRVFTIKYYHEGVFLSENLNVIADAQGSVVSPIPDIDMVQGSIDAYLYDDEEEFMFGSTSFYYVDTDAIPVDVYNTFKTKLEAGLTFEEITGLSAAVLFGKVRKSGSVVTITSPDGITDRVTATTTLDGQRTSVSLNV